MKVTSASSPLGIHNLDQRFTAVAHVPSEVSCFYRAASLQQLHGNRFSLRFGLLLHWEQLDGRFLYNPIWREHVWAIDKLTKRVFDSYSAINATLSVNIGGCVPQKVNIKKSNATVIALDQKNLSVSDLDEIDPLYRRFKTDFLYIEGSYSSWYMSDDLIALRDEMATKQGDFDYMNLVRKLNQSSCDKIAV